MKKSVIYLFVASVLLFSSCEKIDKAVGDIAIKEFIDMVEGERILETEAIMGDRNLGKLPVSFYFKKINDTSFELSFKEFKPGKAPVTLDFNITVVGSAKDGKIILEGENGRTVITPAMGNPGNGTLWGTYDGKTKKIVLDIDYDIMTVKTRSVGVIE